MVPGGPAGRARRYSAGGAGPRPAAPWAAFLPHFPPGAWARLAFPHSKVDAFVKFKMAPNSGFAVLLRSPWWISFALAGAIVAACAALLPRHLVPFAAAGALPLCVIGCIAAWRQARAPSRARVEAARAAALALPWRDLRALFERAWQAEGHTVQALPDGGAADLLVQRGDAHAASVQTVLVAARRAKAARHGTEPLRALHAEVQRRGAQAGSYVVLQGEVSEAARAFAREHGIALLEGAALDTLLLQGQR
ncbi:restriction system protein [Oryzisolibacter propanilivorax]|uniref:Restriction system protein n=2 Tax=Oryzisolibacter propanilivorax TaxID=1527607 RepID=A0A1G9RHI3_9BURK|nr:restriction system protein [Oryzisolibacter propanilivorax]